MMTRKVAVHGASGRMGKSVIRVLAEAEDAELVAALDREGHPELGHDAGRLAGVRDLGVTTTSDLDALEGADVVIDFSLPAPAATLYSAASARSLPVVSGTTGLDQAAMAALEEAAVSAPVVFAPNFSQGVTLLFHLARQAAALLGPAFDAEIMEMHHRRKVDAPSGTAVRLAEVVAEAKDLVPSKHVLHGRSGQVGARPDQEVGVLALRGGDVVGEHTLFLQGMGERIELTHRATDRQIFARGAVRASAWILGQAPGRYDMADVMGIPR